MRRTFAMRTLVPRIATKQELRFAPRGHLLCSHDLCGIATKDSRVGCPVPMKFVPDLQRSHTLLTSTMSGWRI